jgi:putative transposon-encoded protein
MKPMKIETEAYDLREKTVGKGGSSGIVYVPRDWIGKKVKVLLIDELEE